MIDTHAHLNAKQFEKDVNQVANDLTKHNIQSILCVGITKEDSLFALKLSQQHPHIYCSLGMHPHDADGLTPEVMDEYHDLLSNPRSKNYIRAIGESGLDYYRNLQPKEKQQDAFRNLIGLANKFDLPIIVHCREAYDDTLSILKEEGAKKAVIHCFEGSLEFGKAVIELGYMISLSGIITYPKRNELRETVKQLPLSHMMLETDCPYLAPQSKRGKRNEPAFIWETAEKLAEIKGLSLEEIDQATSQNALDFFFH